MPVMIRESSMLALSMQIHTKIAYVSIEANAVVISFPNKKT